MDPLIIERVMIMPDLPGEVFRNGLKVKARPNDKLVLCAIARCMKSDTDMRSGVKDQVTRGKPGEGKCQKRICDLLESCESKITVALIARLCGYTWDGVNHIIKRLKKLHVITDDFKINGYYHQYC